MKEEARMRKKKYSWYRMAVLSYYRGEWTSVEDNDSSYKIKLTIDLDTLIRQCFEDKMNVPNAAKQIEIFFMAMKEQW